MSSRNKDLQSRETNFSFDILIKNGTVYEGTLTEPRQADLVLKDGRIAAVGRLEGPSAKTIDAANLIVTPGFIDVHTDCDLTFKRAGQKRYLVHFMWRICGDVPKGERICRKRPY
jgi:N-acyl-D-aspartate/D-glutamate deacylase